MSVPSDKLMQMIKGQGGPKMGGNAPAMTPEAGAAPAICPVDLLRQFQRLGL